MNLALRILVGGMLMLPSLIRAQYFGMPQPPENSWSIGIGTGPAWLLADVRAAGPGWWTSFYLNRELGRVVDLRLTASFGNQRGQDLTPSRGFLNNTALNGTIDSLASYPAGSAVFYNYRMSGYDAHLSVRVNVNRIFNETDLKNWDLYPLAGFGIFGYRTTINAYRESTGQIYDYAPLASLSEPLVKERLSDLLDDTYETQAQFDPTTSRLLFNRIVRANFILGLGARYHFEGGLSTGLEIRYSFITDDLVDGQMWNENNQLNDSQDKLLTMQLSLDYSF